MPTTMRSMMVVMLVALGVMAGGCARTRIAEPFDVNARPGSLDAEMAFWGHIAERPAVSNDEALHGLLLFADGVDFTRSWEERLEIAKERNWVSGSFNEAPDLALQRGTLARAVAVICRIRGGVMMRVLGPTARYAHRELVWEGIIAGGTANQTITGLEFVGVISKAQDYMLRNDIPFGPEAAGDWEARATHRPR